MRQSQSHKPLKLFSSDVDMVGLAKDGGTINKGGTMDRTTIKL